MDMQPIVRDRRSAIVGLWQRRVPLSAEVLARMGQARIYLRNGQTDRAKATVDALHPLAPLDPKLLQLRAECALATGDYIGAISLFERALMQSDTATLWAGKGTALRALKRLRQAAVCFERASALEPNSKDYLCDASECLLHAGQPRDALDRLKQANPDARTQLLQAMIFQALGDSKSALSDALASARERPNADALRLARRLAVSSQDHAALNKICAPMLSNPKGDAHILAASIQPDRPYLPKATLADIESRANHDTTPTDQRAALNHILFRHYDFIDARAAAQQHLVQSHKYSRLQLQYKRSHDSTLFTVLKRLRFSPLPTSKSSVLPIFVTGLPGSGRTYAHQLLQSAARPAPVRPLHLVNAVMTRFMRQLRQSGLRDISRDDLMGLQSELRAGLIQAAHGSEIVIDTTMLNFRWSGLISAALPEARIVHIKRDKMQTAWAMFARDIDAPGLECRHDLMDLNAFQTQSRGVMKHWEQNSNGSIIAVSGDSLARASGQTARAMIDVCQLKWSENHAPAPQVRQPDWYRYADLLAPLRNTQGAKHNNTPM